ncbi:Rv3654c family TadE-like protein [Nocardia sp. CA-107356]|uniref:Rv3654c family TadE-like protein n=1 Tax=Nocardia sp. CA-107356 TaxID=3239972 RepID=UPI003D8C5122
MRTERRRIAVDRIDHRAAHLHPKTSTRAALRCGGLSLTTGLIIASATRVGVRTSHRRCAVIDARVGRADSVIAAGGERCCGAVRRTSADDGIATVFACLVLSALIGVTLLIGQVGVVIVGRHRAQAAADLAALSAAADLERGTEAGCATAGDIASRMGVRILQCAVVQWDATVTVEGNVPIGLFGKRTVRAVARAGPVEVGE